MDVYFSSLIFILALIYHAFCDVLVYNMDTDLRVISLKDIPSRFGDTIPPDGLRGLLVYAEPANGCTTIKPKPIQDGDKWFVLIKRFDCNFDVKVRNAQKAGYDAAIVHNVNSSDLEPMRAADPSGIKIPSVFISDESGQILRDFYLWDQGYFIVIDDGLPFNINTHLLLPFVIVVGLCVIVMIIFLIVKCIKERRRENRHRLPKSSLKKIPVHKFKKSEDSYEVCAICLEDYVDNDKLRVLPCSHAYHCACIDPWLTKNRRVCPVCKRKVFASGEVDEEADDDSDTQDERAPLVRNTGSGYGGVATSRPFRDEAAEDRNNFIRRVFRRTRNEPVTISSSASSSVSSELSSASEHLPSTHALVTDTTNTNTIITNLNADHSINNEVVTIADRSNYSVSV